MTSHKVWIAGLVGVAITSSTLRAQTPGIPAAGVVPPIGGATSPALAPAGAGAIGPAAAPRTIWSFFGLSSNNLQACKAKLCNSQFGQMLNSMATGPVAGLTGGFIPAL